MVLCAVFFIDFGETFSLLNLNDGGVYCCSLTNLFLKKKRNPGISSSKMFSVKYCCLID